MRHAWSHVWRTGREYLTHWMVAGLIVAATGVAPEHLVADLVQDLHIPTEALHLYAANIDLRWMFLGGGLALVVGDIAWRRIRQSPPPSAAGTGIITPATGATPLPTDKPSLAVLPFDNLSGEPDQDYFTDGMVEEIIASLSRLSGLFVIARNSSFTYKGRAVDVKQVGSELGVRYVLEGSVRKAGAHVRIAVQLIDALNGRHIWAERFEEDLVDIFALQDNISESVVGAIEPNLQHAEIARAVAKPTENLDAYDLYLRALARYYTMTRSGAAAAIGLLQQAIQTDPKYALAKATLAFLHLYRIATGWGDPGDAEAAVALARGALAEDRDNPATLSMAGHVLSDLAHDHEQARVAIDRAIRISPNSALVATHAGYVHYNYGDALLASEYFQRAMRLSPLDPETGIMLAGLAGAQLMAGHNEAGLDFALRAIKETPTFGASYRWAILALVRLGREDEARAMVTRTLNADPDFWLVMFRRPFRDQIFMDEYTRVLRQVGVPDDQAV
jgi:adenylate cyclase